MGTSTGRRPWRTVSVGVPGSVPFPQVSRPKLFPDVSMGMLTGAVVQLVARVSAPVLMPLKVSSLLDTTGGYFSIDVPAELPMNVSVDTLVSAADDVNVSMPMNATAATVIGPANYTDNFNRADGPLGNGWISKMNTGTTGNVIAGNTAMSAVPSATSGANATNQTVSIFPAPATTDNMRAYAASVTAPPAGYYAGIVARADIGMNNYMAVMAAGSAEMAGMYTVINNTFTKRASFAANVFAAGDIIVMQCVGSVYKVIRSRAGTESEIASWTDSGNIQPRGANYRYGGIYTVAIRGSFKTEYGQALDNFGLKDI